MLPPVQIETIAETRSTNSDLLERSHILQEGYWLRAETQTAGRGRQGRDWLPQTGNLYTSTIVRLRPDDPDMTLIALAAGLAFYHAVASFVMAEGLVLKWPNDLMVGSAKMGGILLERREDSIVAGFGLNIVSAPKLADRQTIALREIIQDAAPDAGLVCERLAEQFAKALNLWRSAPPEASNPLIRKWLSVAHPEGTYLSVNDVDGKSVKGRFAGIEPDGALRLTKDDGTVQILRAGDVAIISDQKG